MTTSINRKVYFYQITMKQGDWDANMEDIFSYIQGLSHSENGRYYEFTDDSVMSVHIDSTTFPIKGQIGKTPHTVFINH